MKRETNMEHYRSEIAAFEEDDFYFGVIDGRIVGCRKLCNRRCKFFDGSCSVGRIKWLLSEYKPETVLTQREKGFLDCIGEGWIARDKEGLVCWFEEKPTKGNVEWDVDRFEECYVYLNKDTFPFITWEDEEPWSVEDLRKLKVEGGEADE